MLRIRLYEKKDGTTGFELYDEETNETLYRDDSYSALVDMRKRLQGTTKQANAR
jgi:hypothetical protein